MAYFVTFETHNAAAIDEPAQGFNLEGALAHARELMFNGYTGVAIQDGNGRSISGNELVECCNGDKALLPNLRAVAK